MSNLWRPSLPKERRQVTGADRKYHHYRVKEARKTAVDFGLPEAAKKAQWKKHGQAGFDSTNVLVPCLNRSRLMMKSKKSKPNVNGVPRLDLYICTHDKIQTKARTKLLSLSWHLLKWISQNWSKLFYFNLGEEEIFKSPSRRRHGRVIWGTIIPSDLAGAALQL